VALKRINLIHLGDGALNTAQKNRNGTTTWTRHEKLLLLVLGGVVFLDTLDLSLVQVALPSIGSALDLPESQLQWIVSAFVLGYGGFLLFGGRSADVLGRRRVLVWGLIALIAASVLGAAATDGTLLIAARFIKGMTAAFTAPAALSILTTSFQEGDRRNRALGLYAAAAAAGFTFGLVVGGLLTQLSWRYTFGVVAPVALILLVAALRVVRPDQAAIATSRRIDVAGALTVTGAFLVFVWAIVEAPSAGWTSLRTLAAFALAAGLITIFVAIESRVEQPLVRLGILRSELLIRANLGSLLLFGSATALNIITTLYLQDVLGWGPLKTGLIFMSSSLVTGTVGPRAGALATRVGTTPILLAGAAALVASSAVFLDIGLSSNYAVIVGSRLLAGLGFGLAYPTLNIQALTGVHDDEQGLASGLVGSSFQIGGAIVLAIATATILAHTPAAATTAQTVHAFTAGVYVSAASACLLVTIALAGWRAERRARSEHVRSSTHAPHADAAAPLDLAA
jgi:MFS family permease